MKFVRFWLPVLLWMGLLFYLSSRRNPVVSNDSVLNFFFFKMMHLMFYAALYTWIYRANKYTTKRSKRFWYVSAFIITVLYAISDEVHQHFVQYREASPRDVIIDAVGAGIAWILIDKLVPIVPRKLQMWLAKWQLL